MRSIAGLLATASLIACTPPPSSEDGQGSRETLTVLPITYKWHDDPRCFVKGTELITGRPVDPTLLLWREPSRFKGFWIRTFEGSNFVSATSAEHYDTLNFNRFQAQVYRAAGVHLDADDGYMFEPRVSRVEFIGREARCNTGRPDEVGGMSASSPNIIIVDKLIKLQRIR